MILLQVVRLQTDKFISALTFCSCKLKLDSKIILDLTLRPLLVHAGTVCGFGAALALLLSIGMCVLRFMLAPQNQPLNTVIIKSVKQVISEQSDGACDQAHFIIILIVK